MKVFVGMPQHNNCILFDKIISMGAPIMISANRAWSEQKRKFVLGHVPLYAPSSVMIDSSGFVAMLKYGGYRWDIQKYIDWINNDWPDRWPRPIYAAMDYCCEKEVANNRKEVTKRIDMTIKSCWEMFDIVDSMREEGNHWASYPMPVIQGTKKEDYIHCLNSLPKAELYGVGSVCRRQVNGKDGLLSIIDAIGEILDKDSKLHCFGVKGHALPLLKNLPVASVDSMAWDFQARQTARKKGISCSYGLRAEEMEKWYKRQLIELSPPIQGNQIQLSLFPRK